MACIQGKLNSELLRPECMAALQAELIDAKLDLTRHNAPATQLLQWLSGCLVGLSWGQVIAMHAMTGQPTYALLTYATVACQSL